MEAVEQSGFPSGRLRFESERRFFSKRRGKSCVTGHGRELRRARNRIEKGEFSF